jgi:hypothetical protein
VLLLKGRFEEKEREREIREEWKKKGKGTILSAKGTGWGYSWVKACYELFEIRALS